MAKTPFEAVAGVANACQASPNLVTGGQPSANHMRALKESGAEVLLDIRDPMEPRPFDEPSMARELGIEYVNIPVSGATADDTTMERILTVIRNAGNRQIFFHCGSGNRVGGALLPYFMIDLEMEEASAIEKAMAIGLRSPEMMEWGLDYAHRHSGK